MQKRNALKKGFSILFMSLTLLSSYANVSLAAENGHSMGEMNMGGDTTTQAAPKEKDDHARESMSSMPQSSNPSSPVPVHEAMPGMEPYMEGMEDMSSMNSQNAGHDEPSGGHGESSEPSEGVNWAVVGGFLGINTLVIATAGFLKVSKPLA